MTSKDVVEYLEAVLKSDIDWDTKYFVERAVEHLRGTNVDISKIKVKKPSKKPEFYNTEPEVVVKATKRHLEAPKSVSEWLTF